MKELRLLPDLEGHLARGIRLRDEGADEREVKDFCDVSLELAEMIPSLASDRALQAARAVERIVLQVEGFPAAFRSFSEEAARRLRGSPAPDGLHLELLLALAEAPTWASVDAGSASLPPIDVRRALAHLPEDLLEKANRAVSASLDWEAEVRAFRRRTKTGGDSLRLAASTDAASEEDYLLLRRLPEGELILVRSWGGLYLDWYGASAPSLSLQGVELSPLPPGAAGRIRWACPDAQGELRLLLRLGDTSLPLFLP